MKPALVCVNHPGRGVVARCPSCGLSFCRECVVEHRGRVICAACLKAEQRESRGNTGRFRRFYGQLFAGVRLVWAVLLLWFLFYAGGRMLLRIPAGLHDGTIWKDAWYEL